MTTRSPLFRVVLVAALFLASCSKQNNMVPANTADATAKSANSSLIIPIILNFWQQGPNMPLPSGGYLGRYMPYTFSEPGRAFVGGGLLNTSNGGQTSATDLWMYDTASRSWSQRASLPSTGPTTTSVTCFAIGRFAYVLTWGMEYNQFWRYSYQYDTWTQLKAFPGYPRSNATSMAINGKGYLGLGELMPNDPEAWNDWWQYDPATDTWTAKTSFPGNGRWGAVSFASSTEAYICGGTNSSQGYFSDCWQYDPAADTWTQQASLPASGRAYAVGMSTPTAGIVGTGYNGSACLNDVWAFNFSTKTWAQTFSVPTIRHGAAGVAVGNLLFIGGGESAAPYMGITSTQSTLDDWRYLRW